MSGGSADWVAHGHGAAPRVRWSLTTDAPLVAVEWIAETGDVLAADSSGGLYRLNRLGRVAALSRGLTGLRLLAWSGTGTVGLCCLGDDQVCGLDLQLGIGWSLQMPARIGAIALSPHGTWSAVSLINGTTVLLDADHRTAAHFRTARPLHRLMFLTAVPRLIGAAEFGLIGGYDLTGECLWEQTVSAHVGDLSATGDGGAIYVAGHTLGVPILDRDGQDRGRFLLGGTPHRVSGSYRPDRLAVGTLERHLYWLNMAGDLLWAAEPSDDLTRLCCHPNGRGLLCGLSSGRLVCLAW